VIGRKVKGSAEYGKEEKSELMGNVHMNSKVVKSDGKITRNYKQFFLSYLVLYRLPLFALLLFVLGVLLLVVWCVLW
jgi:hypothetical protein